MVKGADGNVLAPQVQIFDASGNLVNAADLGITASYDSASKSVKMQFPADYKLQEGYTYEVIAKIQPTETAYEKYRTSGYTDQADAGTGTYAGDTGFYSNQNEHAVLMYKYGEQNYTEYYKKPVIKVHPGNLKISKAITGLEDNQEALQKVLQNLSFTCALTKPDGKTETKELKLNTDGLVWNAENNAYEYTFTNLTPGTTYKVNEKIFGLSETDEYTVTEASYADDGYTTTIDNEEKLTATGTIKKDKEAGTTAGNGDKNITVVNDKTTNSPTGIFLHIAPYIVLIGAAIASSLLFFRRKRVKDMDID